MTIEERMDRLAHFTVAWREESRKELAEHREVWRDTQRQINELARSVAGLSDRLLQFEDKVQSQILAIREEMAERDRKMDERIGTLVSSIAELVKRLPAA
jgi:phage shock protein A